MKPNVRRFLRRYAIALGAFILLALFMRSVGKVRFSTTTGAFVAGVLATLCLVGIVYGVWDARRIERKRIAKEDIWMNH